MQSRGSKIVFLVSLLSFLFLLETTTTLAVDNYVSSSTNYRITSDVVSSGGLLSTSTIYGLQSSLSEANSVVATSSSYSVKAGFLQMATAYLSVSTPANISMSGAVNTSGGGVGKGSAAWTVVTDSSGGYSLSIKASTDPALKSTTDAFNNYRTQVAGVPDYNLSEGAAADFFGFTPEGSDISSVYKDDGVSLCNTGSNDTVDKCWDAVTTSNKVITTGSLANHPAGTVTTIKFRAQAGNLINKKSGSYGATIIVTALAL